MKKNSKNKFKKKGSEIDFARFKLTNVLLKNHGYSILRISNN